MADAGDLLNADALVFATPENFGYMAGTLKGLFDRVFYACMTDTTAYGGGTESRIAGRPYAVLVAPAMTEPAPCRALIASSLAGVCARRIPASSLAALAARQGHRVVIWHVPISTPQRAGQLFAEALTIGAL